MSDKEWLEKLQEGDKVHVWWGAEITGVGEVLRLTKTQVLVSHSQSTEPFRINRTTGREVGANRGRWTRGGYRIHPYFDEVEEKRLAKAERQRIHLYLRKVFDSGRIALPLETLQELERIVQQHTKQLETPQERER